MPLTGLSTLATLAFLMSLNYHPCKWNIRLIDLMTNSDYMNLYCTLWKAMKTALGDMIRVIIELLYITKVCDIIVYQI